MSQQGYTPYQHYVPPAQPQYTEQQIRNGDHQQQFPSHNSHDPPGMSQHMTGASYGTVSSLGTGNSQTALNHQVSGYGSGPVAGYYGYSGPGPHGTFASAPQNGLHDTANRHGPPPKNGEAPVFEMSAESAQPPHVITQKQEDHRRMDATDEQTPVQANPWPFYLDVSPTQTKKDNDDRLTHEAKEGGKRQEDTEPVQAFPWPYHGPSTEDEGPQATVHPPSKKNAEDGDSKHNISASHESDKNKPLPPVKVSTLNSPLPPAGEDESVLDDILADMDAQDEQSGCEGTEDAERAPKDPSLRPPPLNLVRPQSGHDGRPRAGSGAISPGGRTYIPYRPGASPTTSPTTQSPPQHQPQQFNMVTAPHHVYLPQAPSALSPPPQPTASTSPFSASPASAGSFSPYRPPSPNAPLSASSTGLGLQSPSQGSLGSPKIAAEPAAFVAYQPSPSPRPERSPAQANSGLASPNQIASPTFPPPQQSSSPRPPASPRTDTSPWPSQGGFAPSSGVEGSGAPSPIAPYPPSPPRVSSPYAYVRPGLSSSHSNPGSPAPLAFYPPSTTQQTAQSQDPISGRLASPPVGAALSRPSSRNDSASVHSGVSSAMGGAPVNPQGGPSRPSPTSSSAGASSQPPQYFSPQLGTQQYQHPPPSPLASSPYNVPQQTYIQPTVSSPQSEPSPYFPPQAVRPHAATLPSPIPSPLSPPPPYTEVDLPPRPGSQPAAGRPYQDSNDYHSSRPQQSPSFPSQPTYAPNQGHHQQSHQPQPQFSPPPPPNLNQSLPPLPPLPPRPSTSHNGRPPPPPPRPQGFGSALPNATNFPPPPRPNYNGNGDKPPPMPPRPPHHQNSYGSTHYASGQHSNKIFGSQSAKKWLDKTERLVEQTIGDILQPQVDQSQRPPGGPPGPHYQGNSSHGGHGPGPPPQPQYAAPPPSNHQRQYHQQHRPLPQNGPYPEMGRGRGRRS